MNHTHYLSKNWALKPKYLDFAKALLLTISLFINLYIFFYWKLTYEDNVGTNDTTYSDAKPFRYVCFIYACCLGLMIMMLTFVKTRLILFDKWREYFSKVRISLLQSMRPDDMEEQLILAMLEKHVSEIKIAEHMKILKKKRSLDMDGEKIE